MGRVVVMDNVVSSAVGGKNILKIFVSGQKKNKLPDSQARIFFFPCCSMPAK